MKKYDKIVWKYAKKNKRKNFYTVIGLILACTLFTTVAYTLFLLKDNFNKNEISLTGNYDAVLQGLNNNEMFKIENNAYVNSFGKIIQGNNLVIKGSEEKINLYNLNKEAIEDIFKQKINLIKGKMPTKGNEVILTEKTARALSKNVNDYLNISGQQYRIAGIYKNLYGINELEGITTNSNIKQSEVYLVVKFKKLNLIEKNEMIQRLDKLNKKEKSEFRVRYNENFVQLDQENLILNIIDIVAMVASIMIMYGSIKISLNEKEEYFALLRCIGASKEKLIYILLKENFILVGIASIIGGLLGTLIAYLNINTIYNILSYNIGTKIEFKFYPEVIMQIIVIGIVSIGVAAIVPIRRLSKKSPIEEIKSIGSFKFKKRRKKLKRKNYNRDLAFRNIKRNFSSFSVSIMVLSLIIIIFSSSTGFYYMSSKASKDMNRETGITIRDNNFHNKEQFYKLKNYIEKIEGNQEVTLKSTISTQMIIPNAIFNGEGVEEKVEIGGKDYMAFDSANIIVYDDASFKAIQNNIIGSNNIEEFNKDGIILIENNIKKESIFRKSTPILKFKNKKVEIYLPKGEEKGKYIEIKGAFMGSIKPKYVPGIGNADNTENLRFIVSENFIKKYEKNLLNEKDLFRSFELNFDEKNLTEVELMNIKDKVESMNGIMINNGQEELKNKMVLNGLIGASYILIIFIMMIIGMNMINNNYNSLNLRKKEFATMLSLGLSKKRLKKILFLEGTIGFGMGAIIGGGISIIIITGIFYVFKATGQINSYIPPYWIVVIGIAISAPISLIGSILPIRSINFDNLIELMRDN